MKTASYISIILSFCLSFSVANAQKIDLSAGAIHFSSNYLHALSDDLNIGFGLGFSRYPSIKGLHINGVLEKKISLLKQSFLFSSGVHLMLNGQDLLFEEQNVAFTPLPFIKLAYTKSIASNIVLCGGVGYPSYIYLGMQIDL